MNAARSIALVAGAVVIVGTYTSVVHRLIVPRGAFQIIPTYSARALKVLFRLAARGRSYHLQDRILALYAPLSLIVLLIVWVLLFLTGISLILLGLDGQGLRAAAREAGSAFFTLGFERAAGGANALVHFGAAFTGLLVLALQIAYLPVLYAAFNRRETLVAMLDTRAGVPSWGPELLARHALVDIVDNLPRLYDQWEIWIADVAESHTNYPVLLYFRSPQPNRNWLTALLSVMDSAAMYLAVAPSRAPSEARLCVRMGFTALREIARAVGIPFDPDPMPNSEISLTRAEFDRGVARLRQAGFPVEASDDEAWGHFRGWRVNYEQIAYALADRIHAARAPWSGPRSLVTGEEIPPFRPTDRRPDDPDGARPDARPTDPRLG